MINGNDINSKIPTAFAEETNITPGPPSSISGNETGLGFIMWVVILIVFFLFLMWF